MSINAHNAKRYLDRLTGQLYEWNADTQSWDTVGDPGVEIKDWPLSAVLDESNDGGGQVIANIADPLNPQDAATKAYVDAAIATVVELFGAVVGSSATEFAWEHDAAGTGNGAAGLSIVEFTWLTDATGTA